MKKSILIICVLFINQFVFAGPVISASGMHDNFKHIFSRDDRPVDGGLIELILSRSELGNSEYSIVRKTTFVSRTTGENIINEEEISYSTPCNFKINENLILSEILCSQDSRMVDGALVELAVNLNDSGTYDVKQHVNYYDRIHGKVVDTVTDRDSGLKLQ